jgi:hypothetical protein
MLHAWRDAAADEALLMAKFNGFQETRFTRPLPRKRLSTRSVVIFLVLPLAFLFSLARPTWTRKPDPALPGPISIPDAFTLDSAFDLSPPYTRIYRWTVSAVPVPNANRTRLVVNGSSPGPIIEANVHDRILVCPSPITPMLISSLSGLPHQRPGDSRNVCASLPPLLLLITMTRSIHWYIISRSPATT